jgi:hypothetical protein
MPCLYIWSVIVCPPLVLMLKFSPSQNIVYKSLIVLSSSYVHSSNYLRYQSSNVLLMGIQGKSSMSHEELNHFSDLYWVSVICVHSSSMIRILIFFSLLDYD